MRSNFKSKRSKEPHSWRDRWKQWPLLFIAPGATALVAIFNSLSLLQPSEWAVLDLFIRVRPLEPPDRRIVVVTITDEDITKIGKWPVPDQLLAQALSNLNGRQPRAIGLDLYRDLPVEPGHQKLVNVFESMPNLIGVQRAFGLQKVAPPPALAKLNQVADANIPEDPDKRVRRAMLTSKDGASVSLGLGLAIALKYLEKEQITPVTLNDAADTYQLGRARFEPFRGGDGGYVDADDRGYQMLLNYRGPAPTFQTLSFMDVLQNRFPEDWVRDRVVLIGTSAESVKDFFITPYSDDQDSHTDWTPGVFIHANIVSQILSAAQQGRPLLRGFSGLPKWLWIMLWSYVGVLVSWKMLQSDWVHKQLSYGISMVSIVLVSGALVVISYLVFLNGLWLPVAASVFALNCAAILCFAYHSYKLQRLAYFDGLTQAANRRYFDLYLARQVHKRGRLSLILCDVDHFKLYNDTYGHPEGDVCLQQVVLAIRQTVRWADFVARYGGEEFAVILPATDIGDASIIAERILNQVRELKIPHQKSITANYVTISCGVATVEIDDQRLIDASWSGGHLISAADQALYRSKQEGRDRFTLDRLV
ncbi:MAG: CHASE2 domain-containing protein [Kovacikia sp.]